MIAAEPAASPAHHRARHEPHHYTIFHVDVDDVAAYLEKAKSLGAKALVPPVEIPRGHLPDAGSRGEHSGLWKSKK